MSVHVSSVSSFDFPSDKIIIADSSLQLLSRLSIAPSQGLQGFEQSA